MDRGAIHCSGACPPSSVAVRQPSRLHPFPSTRPSRYQAKASSVPSALFISVPATPCRNACSPRPPRQDQLSSPIALPPRGSAPSSTSSPEAPSTSLSRASASTSVPQRAVVSTSTIRSRAPYVDLTSSDSVNFELHRPPRARFGPPPHTPSAPRLASCPPRRDSTDNCL